jgi:hemerythrin-like metal-binding protein
MAFMYWREELSVGITSIDRQHQKLIELINELEKAARTRQESKTLDSVLSELWFYTENHFKTEEALMQKYNYPGLKSHKVEHQALMNRVADFRRKFENGTLTDVHDLANFLMGWLEGHILVTDKKYSPHLVGSRVR